MATASTPRQTTVRGARTARALATRTTLGTALAVLLALTTRGLALEVDPSLAGQAPFDTLAVAGSAVAAGVGAALVWTGLVRWAARPVRRFLVVAGAVFAVMLVPVATLAPELGVTGAGQAWLVALHAAVALPLVALLVWPVRVTTGETETGQGRDLETTTGPTTPEPARRD